MSKKPYPPELRFELRELHQWFTFSLWTGVVWLALRIFHVENASRSVFGTISFASLCTAILDYVWVSARWSEYLDDEQSG